MQASWRRDVEGYLSSFVASHRGLRMGRLFGALAIYAGPHLVSRTTAHGLAVKLPAAAVEAARKLGGSAARRGRHPEDWVVFRAGTISSLDAIGPFLEVAARHAALAEGRMRQ